MVKRRRNNDLLAIQNQVSLADHLRWIGRRVEVLVEGPSLKANGGRKPAGDSGDSGPLQLTGRTPTDHIVVFDGNPRLAGQTLEVDIDQATAFTLFGTVVTSEHVALAAATNNVAPRIPDPPRRQALPMI
jgi:tRNA-2-methylthio-N6-dimethylallyladenosine synthase